MPIQGVKAGRRGGWIAALALLITLAGCATGGGSDATPRYMLPGPEPTGEAPPTPARDTLVIDGVTVSRYLDDPGIVLQTDAIRLHQASNHQWAEPLNRQLWRGLRDRLSQRLPATRVLDGGNPSGALHLSVEVDRFQGRYDGVAVTSGRWELRDASGGIVEVAPFAVTTPLDEDGYPALVHALGSNWDDVAARIAEGIRRYRSNG
ncbi:PqiC family protein [Modicisalibacter coralii]|uniref:PqiC family protein n=1 Tax=Modicisalibacter coralii TaxID=2304602 RepID=UPI00100A9438|nr:PqiC family protein [Halomonas coralii]